MVLRGPSHTHKHFIQKDGSSAERKVRDGQTTWRLERATRRMINLTPLKIIIIVI